MKEKSERRRLKWSIVATLRATVKRIYYDQQVGYVDSTSCTYVYLYYYEFNKQVVQTLLPLWIMSNFFATIAIFICVKCLLSVTYT